MNALFAEKQKLAGKECIVQNPKNRKKDISTKLMVHVIVFILLQDKLEKD